MITWGKIEGTMFLGIENNEKNKFSVPQTPIRDEIGQKLANKALSKKREEKLNQKK